MAGKAKKNTESMENQLARLEEELEQVSSALHQSENLFQTLIKNIPGVVYLCNYDKHWTMHYIVKEIENITGYPASDFINNNVRSFVSIIHPDDTALIDRTVRESVNNDKPYEMEFRIIRKDGEIIWVYEKGRQVHSSDNKTWLNGIILDVTTYKQNVIELDIAMKEWKATFEAMPNGVFLLNKKCQIIKCNKAGCKLLAKNKNDIIGKRYCQAIYNIEQPPQIDPYLKMFKSGSKQKEIRKLNNKTVEITVAPITDKKGSIYGSVILIVDITSLKNTELQLKSKQKELQSIFHTAPVGIGVVNGTVFVKVNQQVCKLSGYKKEELIGKDTRMLYINDAEYKRFGDNYLHLRGSKIAKLKSYLKCKNGEEVKVAVNISCLNPDTNEFTFTVTDISYEE